MRLIYFISILLFTEVFTNNLSAQNLLDEASLLMQLDREFDKATSEKGVDGWVAYFAPNGSMLG